MDGLNERLFKLRKEPVLWPALVLGLSIMAAGGCGLAVLMDPERKGFLANTKFGELYILMSMWNPFASAILTNIGLIGTVIAGTQLHAVRAEKREAAKGKKERKQEARAAAKQEEKGGSKGGQQQGKKDS